MADFAKFINNFNPDPSKAGKVLVLLNAAGMVFAAVANTVAAAADKNTSKEDKKFLIPAGAVTGVANIGIYYAMTTKIIDGLKKSATNVLDNMKQNELVESTLKFVEKDIKKSEKGFLGTGLFKKSDEYVANMKATFLKDGAPTSEAISQFKENFKGGAGVLGAFAGAVVGCAILTPIIRDVSAYFVQKHMEKGNPNLSQEGYKPYFDPSHLKTPRGLAYGEQQRPAQKAQKQPLTMKNYMAFTNKSMKV